MADKDPYNKNNPIIASPDIKLPEADKDNSNLNKSNLSDIKSNLNDKLPIKKTVKLDVKNNEDEEEEEN